MTTIRVPALLLVGLGLDPSRDTDVVMPPLPDVQSDSSLERVLKMDVETKCNGKKENERRLLVAKRKVYRRRKRDPESGGTDRMTVC